MNKHNVSDTDHKRAFQVKVVKRLLAFEVALRKAIGDEAIHDAALTVYTELHRDDGDSLFLPMALAHICAEIIGNLYCKLEPAIDPDHDAVLIEMATGQFSAALENLLKESKGMTAREHAVMREYLASIKEQMAAIKAEKH